MKKWQIGGGVVSVLTVVVLAGVLATGAFAQGPTPSENTMISPEEAEAIALAANPDAVVVETDLDQEDGVQVYEVKLDNGMEVQVDASNGDILGTEQESANEADEAGDADNAQEEVDSQVEDADQDSGDVDDVQDQSGSQADDEVEASQVEDAPAQ